MLELTNPEPRASQAIAAWYEGTVCRLWAGAAAAAGSLKKSQRWVPYKADAGWRLCRGVPGKVRYADFHGGNARPLTMTEAEAIALAAALNRRPETSHALAPGKRY